MYRRPKFLEELHAIREEMSREADYDMELFAEMARTGERPHHGVRRNIRGLISRAPSVDEAVNENVKTHIIWSGRKRFQS